MIVQTPPFPYEEYQALLREAFPCGHIARTLCASRDTRKRWLIRQQCPDCGKLFRRQLPFSVLGTTPPDSLPACDLLAAQHYDATFYSAAFALRDLFGAARVEAWWSQYSTYLESDEWRERSRATIAAAGGICTYCCQRPAVQAHHISYDRVGCERPEDLRAICLQCHRERHLDAINAPGRLNPKWKGEADTTSAFAVFLAELAREAAETSERNLEIQRKVIRLTRVLYLLTIALLVIAGVQTLLMIFR